MPPCEKQLSQLEWKIKPERQESRGESKKAGKETAQAGYDKPVETINIALRKQKSRED